MKVELKEGGDILFFFDFADICIVDFRTNQEKINELKEMGLTVHKARKIYEDQEEGEVYYDVIDQYIILRKLNLRIILGYCRFFRENINSYIKRYIENHYGGKLKCRS